MRTQHTSHRLALGWHLGAVMLVAPGLALYIWNAWTSTSPTDGRAQTLSSEVVAQVNEGGQVTVNVTRDETVTHYAFTVVLDTHAVDLDQYDLRELAVLRIAGTESRPTAWDAPKGGHHRQGTLSFAKTSENGPIDLVIRDVAGVPERIFRWASHE